MVASIVSVGLKAVILGFAFIGLAALLLAGMIASPVRRPPELMSVSKTAGAVDRSTMPALERFHARDGTELCLSALSAPVRRQPAHRHCGPWLVGIQRRRSTRCPARWLSEASRPTRVNARPWRILHQRRYRLSRPARGRFFRFVAEIRKTIPPRRDAARSFRPAAALRCASPARRSGTCSCARCCSRLISATTRRAAAECGRLGQPRYSALLRVVGAAPARNRLFELLQTIAFAVPRIPSAS